MATSHGPLAATRHRARQEGPSPQTGGKRSALPTPGFWTLVSRAACVSDRVGGRLKPQPPEPAPALGGGVSAAREELGSVGDTQSLGRRRHGPGDDVGCWSVAPCLPGRTAPPLPHRETLLCADFTAHQSFSADRFLAEIIHTKYSGRKSPAPLVYSANKFMNRPMSSNATPRLAPCGPDL